MIMMLYCFLPCRWGATKWESKPKTAISLGEIFDVIKTKTTVCSTLFANTTMLYRIKVVVCDDGV